MSDDQLDVVVEAQIAADGQNTVRSLAQTIDSMARSVQAMEQTFNTLFTRALPATVNELRNITAQLAAAERSAQTLGRYRGAGGASQMMTSASIRGATQAVRNAPEMGLLALEQAQEKRLEARLAIYNRLRQQMPQASDEQLLSAYRRAMAFTAPPRPRAIRAGSGEDIKAQLEEATKARRDWMAQTEQEAREFYKRLPAIEADAYREAQRENMARNRARQQAEDQTYREAQADNRRFDRQRAAQARLEQANFGYDYRDANAENRRLDRQRQSQFDQDYRDAYAEKHAREFAGYYDAHSENRLRNLQVRQEADALERVGQIEREIIGYEQRIAKLRAEGSATSAGYATILYEQINALRQEQSALMSVAGAQREVDLARASRTPVTGPGRSVRQRPSEEETRNARVQRQLDDRNARLEYKGGAPSLMAEAHTLVNYAGIGAAIAGAGAAVKSLVDLEDALNGIQAVSGATSAQMDQLGNALLRVAAGSNKSVKDIADATELLIRSGYSLEQTVQMVGPITKLATATNATVKDTADSVTEVMRMFKLSVDGTSQVTTSLGALSLKSKLSMDDVGKAFKGAGEIAHASGLQFNEVTAAFGALAAAGMKDGASMGQGLKALIEALDNPSKKLIETLGKFGLTAQDINVQSNGLAGAFDNLKDHGVTAGDMMTGLSVRSISAFNALSNQLPVLHQLTNSLAQSSDVNRAADIRMQSLGATAQNLGNRVLVVTHQAFQPFLDTIRLLMETAGGVITAIEPLTPVITTIGTALASLALAATIVKIQQLAAGFAGMIPFATSWNIAIAMAAITTGEFGVALTALNAALGPVGWLAIGIGTVVTALGLMGGAQRGAAEEIQRTSAEVEQARQKYQDYGQKMAELDGFISMLVARHDSLARNTDQAGAAAETASQRFAQWGLQIDAQSKKVDVLITRLVELRRQMALKQAAEAQDQLNSLNKQTRLDQNQQQSASQQLQLLTEHHAGSVKGLLGDDLFRLISSGRQISPEQASAIRARLAGENGQSVIGKDILSALDSYTSAGTSLELDRAQTATAQGDLASATVQGTKKYNDWNTSVLAALTTARQAQQEALQIKSGPERLKAMQAAEKGAADSAATLQSSGLDIAKQFSGDPRIGSGGTSAFTGNDYLHQLMVMGGTGQDGWTPKDWQARSRALQTMLKNERPGTARYQQLSDQLKNAKLNALGPNADEEQMQSVIDQFDAQQQGAEKREGRRQNRVIAGVDRADTQALRDQVEALTGSASQLNDPALAAVLQRLRTAGVDEIKRRGAASGASSSDIQRELADFAVQFQKEQAKYIHTANQHVYELQEEQGKKAAHDADKSDGLAAELKVVTDSMTKAHDASIKALQEQYEAKGWDLGGAAFKAKLDELNQKFNKDLGKILIDKIDEFYKAASDQIKTQAEASQGQWAMVNAHLQATHNYWGRSNLGNTHRYAADDQMNKNEITAQQQVVSYAQQQYDNQAAKIASLQATHDANPGAMDAKDFDKTIEEANTQLATLKKSLDDSQAKLTQMSEHAQPFTTFSQAAAAAWNQFANDARINEPTFETIADGLTGGLEKAHQGLQNFFGDLMNGTKSGKQAFKDLGIGILQEMQQMATKILADMAFKQLISLLASFGLSIGGATAGTAGGAAPNLPTADMSTTPMTEAMGGPIRARHYAGGGRVRHMADGGFNKDSVPAKLMPGEFVMRKTAVDFIGEDNLQAMNMAGNHRASMPSLKDALPKREPDMTNVWVVAPETKPTLGKNDVIQMINEDMLAGGQTKKLVKAIATGSA